jgi:hypothetical protein
MKNQIIALLAIIFAVLACQSDNGPAPATQVPVDRLSAIPGDVVKGTSQNDAWPPVIAAGWSQPQPLNPPVTTAGAEDSPFITMDGQTLYFVFTPDLRVPPEKQLLDGLTGIWMSHRSGEGWGVPERVHLEKSGEVALDGCEFVLGDSMYFCSVRAGNKREIDLYTATWRGDHWADWKNAGDRINRELEAGEMHITADGKTLIFGSKRPGGLGGYDLWISQRTGGGWSDPVNLGAPVNTPGDENRPYLSPDGGTLWYDSTSRKGLPGPAIFRSIRQPDGTWSTPEEIVSQFAGEPNLTSDGRTLYFVHHYFSADMSRMIEADIYVAYQNTP